MSAYRVTVRTAAGTYTYFAIAPSSLHAWTDAFDCHAGPVAIMVRPRKGAGI